MERAAGASVVGAAASASNSASKMTEGLSGLSDKITEGLTVAARERAELVRSQARQLYVIVSTIAAATVSIWIALFAVAS